MKLHEMHAGDVVAIERLGEVIAIRIGRVLGIQHTKGRFEPTGVVVDRLELDERTFVAMPFDARCEYEMGLLMPDVDVVERIATGEYMRGLVRSRAAAARDAAPTHKADGIIDPMSRMQRAAADLSDQKDIPF